MIPTMKDQLILDRKVFGPVWKNCVIPSSERISHDNASQPFYYKGLMGFKYAVGDDTLFDGPFSFVRNMHEYRIQKVNIDIAVVCTPKTPIPAHPVEISSIVIPIDTDADDDTEFKSFEHALEHPGARSSINMSDVVAHHRITWRPTEPSDQDWRLVKNDNIVYLYVFFRCSIYVLKEFRIDSIIRLKAHVNFRGVNFDSKSALMSSLHRSPNDVLMHEGGGIRSLEEDQALRRQLPTATHR